MNALIECALKELGVDRNKPPHWIPKIDKVRDQATGELVREYQRGFTCSYCGKHNWAKQETCDGCNSRMDEHLKGEKGVIRKRRGTLDLFETRFNADIDSITVVDAVEVVRCKNCTQWGGVVFGNVCRRWSAPLAGMKNCTGPNDFCSYGERREAEKYA